MTATRRAATRGAAPRLSGTDVALVLVAGAVVVVEVLQLGGLVGSFELAGYGLSPSIVPALLFLPVLGRRLLGRSLDAHTEVVYWAAVSLALAAVATAFVRLGDGTSVLAVLIAATDEELVYRLAVPLVVSLVLVRWGARPTSARALGFAAAGLWFVLLPGHRAQMSHVADALPFLAFAALAALVVYRSGSVVAVIAIHACTDLCNILTLGHQLGNGARTGILLALFLLLVMAYGSPSSRRSSREILTAATHRDAVDVSRLDEVDVIDLRDPVGDEPEPVEAEVGVDDEHVATR